MKVIKIKKEHKGTLKELKNSINGIALGLEALSESMLRKKELLWEIIRREYPEVAKHKYSVYDHGKQQINIYMDKTEYMVDKIDKEVNK